MTGGLSWHVSRSSGLVAWALLAVAVIWGLLLASRLLERRPSPAWLLDLHRHLGALAFLLVCVHVGAIWVDDFVDYTPAELVVPFTSDLERVPVALGVIALWLLVVVQATSWQRARISSAAWRRLHRLSGPLVLLASLHGWLVGTDTGHQVVAVVAAVLIAEMVLIAGLRLGYGRGPLRSERDQREGGERQGHPGELRS